MCSEDIFPCLFEIVLPSFGQWVDVVLVFVLYQVLNIIPGLQFLVGIIPCNLISFGDTVTTGVDGFYTIHEIVEECLLSLGVVLLVGGIAFLRDMGLTLTGLEHEVALRLDTVGAFDGAEENLGHRADKGHVDIFSCCFYAGSDHTCYSTLYTVGDLIALLRMALHGILDVVARGNLDVVAGLDTHVLTHNLHVAVRGREGDAREGVDAHVTHWRTDVDLAFM